MEQRKAIEIYWDDLTESKQKEILEALGDNGNYNLFPIATIEVGQEEEPTEDMFAFGEIR